VGALNTVKHGPAPLSGVHHLMQLPRAALSLALGYMPSPPSGGGCTMYLKKRRQN